MQPQDIDKFLDALKDGKWHNTEETTKETRIQENKAKLIISFLLNYQFIQADKNGRIKLNTPTKQLLAKLGETDPESSYDEITA